MIDKTLLFIDVVDSTALVERLGHSAAAALWAEHDRIARELLVLRRGRDIDDRVTLAVSLCIRGRLDVAEGDFDAARSALDETVATAQTMSASVASDLGQAIAKLRAVLA